MKDAPVKAGDEGATYERWAKILKRSFRKKIVFLISPEHTHIHTQKTKASFLLLAKKRRDKQKIRIKHGNSKPVCFEFHQKRCIIKYCFVRLFLVWLHFRVCLTSAFTVFGKKIEKCKFVDFYAIHSLY